LGYLLAVEKTEMSAVPVSERYRKWKKKAL
jgi:hypothetical protein